MSSHNKLLLALAALSLCAMSMAESKNCVQKFCPKNVKGVTFLPVVDDCEKFIACYNGRTSIRSCPEDYRFDVNIQACAPEKRVPCNECENDDSEETSDESSESSPSSEKDSVVITPEVEKEVPTPSNNISERCIVNSVTPISCPSELSDDRLLSHPDDCQLFYYCVSSTSDPICRECPAGLHFNPVKKVCDHPGVAGCELKRKRPSNSRAEIEPCNEHNPELADLRPDPEDCNKYYVCDWGRLIHMSCPEGMHFSTIFNICDIPQNARCELESSKKVKGHDESAESREDNAGIVLDRVELVPRNNISQKCINNSVTPVQCPVDLPEDRLLPHPDDCQLFYYCITSSLPPICRDCPAGLHFNPVKKVCDKPEEAGCKVSREASVTPKTDLECNEHNGVWADLRPDPKDCGKYYVCDWGKLIHMLCPPGTHFNTSLKVCDLPQNARCESETTDIPA